MCSEYSGHILDQTSCAGTASSHTRTRPKTRHVRPIRQDLETCSTNYNDLKWDMCLRRGPLSPFPLSRAGGQLTIRENDPSRTGKQLLSGDEKRTEVGIRGMAERRGQARSEKKRLPPGLPGLCLPEHRRPYTCPGILLCGARGTHPFPDDGARVSCKTARHQATVVR